MNFDIELDCDIEDQAELLEHQSALLAAFMMFKSYYASKDSLVGIGPELYAEQWMRNFIVFSSSSFEDLILIYFTKILQGIQK